MYERDCYTGIAWHLSLQYPFNYVENWLTSCRVLTFFLESSIQKSRKAQYSVLNGFLKSFTKMMWNCRYAFAKSDIKFQVERNMQICIVFRSHITYPESEREWVYMCEERTISKHQLQSTLSYHIIIAFSCDEYTIQNILNFWLDRRLNSCVYMFGAYSGFRCFNWLNNNRRTFCHFVFLFSSRLVMMLMLCYCCVFFFLHFVLVFNKKQ